MDDRMVPPTIDRELRKVFGDPWAVREQEVKARLARITAQIGESRERAEQDARAERDYIECSCGCGARTPRGFCECGRPLPCDN